MYIDLTEKIIKKYGRQCVIFPFGNSNSFYVYAFVNPLLYKNKQHLGGDYLPDGFYDGGHYLYIGESRISLSDLPHGSVVKCGGDEFFIKRADQYFIEDKAVYSWAVLQLRKRGDENA